MSDLPCYLHSPEEYKADQRHHDLNRLAVRFCVIGDSADGRKTERGGPLLELELALGRGRGLPEDALHGARCLLRRNTGREAGDHGDGPPFW